MFETPTGFEYEHNNSNYYRVANGVFVEDVTKDSMFRLIGELKVDAGGDGDLVGWFHVDEQVSVNSQPRSPDIVINTTNGAYNVEKDDFYLLGFQSGYSGWILAITSNDPGKKIYAKNIQICATRGPIVITAAVPDPV